MTTSATTPDTTGVEPRNRQLIVVAAAITALALVFSMVSSVTGAAWTDTTDNSGNSWATGQVSLTDDDAGVAMFEVTGMVPGTVETNDITVTNDSTVPLDVKLYGANFSETEESALGTHLNLTVGTTDGGSEVYSGTLSDFATTHTGYADGTTAVSLDAAAAQTYFFAVELDNDAPDSVQDTSAQIDFVWEGHTQ